METREGNEIIAEFMQLKKGSTNEERWYRWDEENNGQGYFTDLKYHSSWDWIMPVVKKIEEHKYPEKYKEDLDESWRQDCAYMRTFYGNMARINRYALHEGATQIEAVWKACVEFIQSNLKN